MTQYSVELDFQDNQLGEVSLIAYANFILSLSRILSETVDAQNIRFERVDQQREVKPPFSFQVVFDGDEQVEHEKIKNSFDQALQEAKIQSILKVLTVRDRQD